MCDRPIRRRFRSERILLISSAVFESGLNGQGIQALIGRDDLSNSLLVYDGRADLFSLAF